MKNGFYLYTAELSEHRVPNQAVIDGRNCPDLKSFVQQLAEAFNFPEYFSENLDSLEEILNDMSWLEEPGFRIIIANYPSFLKTEKRNRKYSLLELFWETASQWQQVPNYPGEEVFRERADFRIYVESCPQIKAELEELEIPVMR